MDQISTFTARVGWGNSPKIPTRVYAAQRDRDFGTPDLERGIHIRDFSKTVLLKFSKFLERGIKKWPILNVNSF